METYTESLKWTDRIASRMTRLSGVTKLSNSIKSLSINQLGTTESQHQHLGNIWQMIWLDLHLDKLVTKAVPTLATNKLKKEKKKTTLSFLHLKMTNRWRLNSKLRLAAAMCHS